MREPSRNVSAETVRLADSLATEILEGNLNDAVPLADQYRTSRIRDASEAMKARSDADAR